MNHHRCRHCGLVNPETVPGARAWSCIHCGRVNRSAARVPSTLLEQVMQVGDGRQASGFRRAA